MLSPDHRTLVIDRESAGPLDDFKRFVSFGVGHIILGHDYLLFVTLLMIVVGFHRGADGIGDRLKAPAARSWRR